MQVMLCAVCSHFFWAASTSGLLLSHQQSHRWAAQVLLDPVCMLTCYPQLLANFVYKLPTVRQSFSSALGMANAVRWILARELVIAEVRVPLIVGESMCCMRGCEVPETAAESHFRAYREFVFNNSRCWQVCGQED